jgi:hypothetical protein
MEEDQHEDNESVNLDEEIDVEETNEDDGNDEIFGDEEEEEIEEYLHSIGDPEREAGMWRRLMVTNNGARR